MATWRIQSRTRIAARGNTSSAIGGRTTRACVRTPRRPTSRTTPTTATRRYSMSMPTTIIIANCFFPVACLCILLARFVSRRLSDLTRADKHTPASFFFAKKVYRSRRTAGRRDDGERAARRVVARQGTRRCADPLCIVFLRTMM